MEVLSSTETLGRRSWGWYLGVWSVNHVCSSHTWEPPQHFCRPHCYLEGVSGSRWARSETEVNLRQAIPDTTACNHACVTQCSITLHDFHVMLWPLAALLQAAGLSQASTLSRKRTWRHARSCHLLGDVFLLSSHTHIHIYIYIYTWIGKERSGWLPEGWIAALTPTWRDTVVCASQERTPPLGPWKDLHSLPQKVTQPATAPTSVRGQKSYWCLERVSRLITLMCLPIFRHEHGYLSNW